MQEKKKIHQKIKREITFFCEGKLCIEIQNRKDNEKFIIRG